MRSGSSLRATSQRGEGAALLLRSLILYCHKKKQVFCFAENTYLSIPWSRRDICSLENKSLLSRLASGLWHFPSAIDTCVFCFYICHSLSIWWGLGGRLGRSEATNMTWDMRHRNTHETKAGFLTRPKWAHLQRTCQNFLTVVLGKRTRCPLWENRIHSQKNRSASVSFRLLDQKMRCFCKRLVCTGISLSNSQRQATNQAVPLLFSCKNLALFCPQDCQTNQEFCVKGSIWGFHHHCPQQIPPIQWDPRSRTFVHQRWEKSPIYSPQSRCPSCVCLYKLVFLVLFTFFFFFLLFCVCKTLSVTGFSLMTNMVLCFSVWERDLRSRVLEEHQPLFITAENISTSIRLQTFHRDGNFLRSPWDNKKYPMRNEHLHLPREK